MMILLAFAALAVVAIVATVAAVARDGYRAQPVCPARIPERATAAQRPSRPQTHNRPTALRPSSAR